MYRGETSPPSPAPHGSPGQGEARAQWVTASPCRHSLAEELQPNTFGLEPPAANTAPARVPSQGEPPWWHSPMQTFLGVTCVEGSLRGSRSSSGWAGTQHRESPEVPLAPSPPALSPQPVGGGSVPGWKGLVDNHLHDKILLDLGLLQSCAVSEQLA